MQTYATDKPKPTRKEITKRTIAQSEYPFRVFDGRYQFKELEAARKFSMDLAATPKSGHRHKVEMMHRHLEMQIKGDGDPIVQALLLDVTTDSPDEAEAKYVDTSAPTTRLERSPVANQPMP